MKKGFTLIELLAVIVLLAIIALIAIPIVLNIISDTKKSSTLKSADFYLDAVEFSVASSTLKGQTVKDDTYEIKKGDICLNVDCNDKIEVEVNGEVPKEGTVTIRKGKITGLNIILDNKEIYKTSKNEMVYVKLLDEVCKIKSGTPKAAGAKYECKVDPNKDPYTFYVLTTPSSDDTRINLIMDQNINSDGSPAGMTGVTQSTNALQYNLVAWNNSSGQSTNAYGPVTAMQFLYNATKGWTNLDPVNYIYNDKTIQGTTAENTSYISFVSSHGVATIIPLTGETITIGNKSEPLRARMPIYSSNASITEVTSKINASYLYANIDSSGSTVPYGYWTISSYASDSSTAWRVDYGGSVRGNYVYRDGLNGVRPVISLKI